MADNYSVLFTGRLEPDADLERAATSLAGRFHMHPQRARGMLAAGEEVVVETGLSEEEAREHRRALEAMGISVRVLPALPEDGLAPAGSGTTRIVEPAEAAGSVGSLHLPRRVAMSRGWSWLRQGFSMVFASPAGWIGALLIWAVLNFVLNLIPLVNLLSALLAPVFMGGLMRGAREQDRGSVFNIESLFAGFSTRTGPLFLVGLLYMVGFIAMGLVMLVIAGGFFYFTGQIAGPAQEVTREVVVSPAPWAAGAVAFVLFVALMMTYWFAPVLVMLDNVSPVRAMGLSFLTCLKNILAFVLYILITIVLCVLGTIPFLLGLLIVMPVIVASAYAAYRDIFRA